MSRLSKLLGRPQEFEIAGETFKFYPLALEDIDLVFELENEKTRGEAMKKLIAKAMKQAVPDATPEEINKIAVSHFKPLTEAILQVNGISQAQPQK